MQLGLFCNYLYFGQKKKVSGACNAFWLFFRDAFNPRMRCVFQRHDVSVKSLDSDALSSGRVGQCDFGPKHHSIVKKDAEIVYDCACCISCRYHIDLLFPKQRENFYPDYFSRNFLGRDLRDQYG